MYQITKRMANTVIGIMVCIAVSMIFFDRQFLIAMIISVIVIFHLIKQWLFKMVTPILLTILGITLFVRHDPTWMIAIIFIMAVIYLMYVLLYIYELKSMQ